ncbi:hypothetical protein GGU10DRAFT_380861 [Lentinula aff. detonsa]|uniref:Uncharacterized protein n=1 Tax=Lentinula aff. detonsa TaxID=2804958 RepID=A0AA38K7M1_9AGAR|nr:hypothetical protein GGU10DRAFT_380861 [Lentinula aff. detonsa]
MTSFSIYPQPRRIGPPLKRSNILDNNGFNDWDDYSVEPVDTHLLNPRKRFPIDALVDHHTICSSTPIDLGLEFRYCNPSTGEVKTLWARDTELRWTEITAGTHSGIVPDRYVSEVGAHGQRYGPMCRDVVGSDNGKRSKHSTSTNLSVSNAQHTKVKGESDLSDCDSTKGQSQGSNKAS